MKPPQSGMFKTCVNEGLMLHRLSSWANAGLSGVFPERRLILRSETSARYVRLSPLGQMLGATAICAVLGWTGYSTLSFVDAASDAALAESRLESATELRDAQIAEMTRDVMRLAEDISAERRRAYTALTKLSDQHATLSNAVANERELASALTTHRNRLDMLSGEHDASMEVCEATVGKLTALEVETHSLKRENETLAGALSALNATLASVSAERDDAISSSTTLAASLGALQSEVEELAERRRSTLARLEDAAQLSLGGLETVFERSGVKLDPILAEVRREYAGEGGPFIQEGPAEASASDDEGDSARIQALFDDLERINLLRIATDRLPFAKPVRVGRFTSGFGRRKDPFNGRVAHHSGLDFAAPRGTPIYATGSGEVVKAGWIRGYGKVVTIKHAFGYETVFAHLHRIRVKIGDVVERGDRIGDMGNTGRSTGTHLHYEIRIGGKAVNPSKYIEAARHVL